MSKIEVNTIDTQCGSALQIGDGNTATIGLGKSGDTITIPSGATIVNSGTQTGFGREGSVDWVTTAQTGTVTAATGKGYFVNTTSGGITVNLPAGAAGSIVAVADYTRTFNSNNCTISANGSEKIGGVDADATLDVDGQSATFVYVDGTEGWINVQETQTSQTGVPPYVTATGGTPCAGTTCGDYRIHTFTGPGTFTVTAAGDAAPCSGTGSNTVDYLVVGGGGAGGMDEVSGGGGGAGGYRESPGTSNGSYTVSPRGAAPAVALPVSIQGYAIAVGAGGVGVQNPPSTPIPVGAGGSLSTFSTIDSAGGGGGGSDPGASVSGDPGGSGGGATAGTITRSGGTGNTPPTNPVQGMDGGNAGNASSYRHTGGGGGATTVGESQTSSTPNGGDGGNGGTGGTSSINGTPTGRAGGGGGSADNRGCASYTAGTATCGGGTGGDPSTAVASGTVNKGGGGGGNRGLNGVVANKGAAGSGGSGIVILRYKFQN